MESDIRANMGTHHHTITPSHHTHEDAARDVRVCGLADRDERILYTTATHTCCILLLLVAHVRWHPPRGHSEAATAGPHIPSHDKPRRGDGIYRRRAKDQGPRQETASDVRDCHLDERELELQPLAGRHEELSAAILGGDLHAWLGLGLGSGSGLGISTPGAWTHWRRRGGAEVQAGAEWHSFVVQSCRATFLKCGRPEPSSRALQPGPGASHGERRWLAALFWSMQRHPYRRRPC